MRTHKILLCIAFAALAIVLVRELFSLYPLKRISYANHQSKANRTVKDYPNFILQSENGDIRARMKFQQKQVKQYCNKVGRSILQTGRSDESIRHKNNLLNVFINNSSTILVCYVGSTDLSHMMTLMNKTQASLYVLQNDHNIFKFSLVRHPLERLLFVYIDYLKDPLFLSSNHFPNKLKQEIFEKYRPVVYQHWIATGGSYNISISFSEFINYFIESFKELLDSPLQPFTQVCQPCLFRYHFYGRYQRLQAEVSEVTKYLKLDSRVWQQEQPVTTVTSINVTDLLFDYYGKLTEAKKSQLYDAIRSELLFYYQIYPGDRLSYLSVLGIHNLIYNNYS